MQPLSKPLSKRDSNKIASEESGAVQYGSAAADELPHIGLEIIGSVRGWNKLKRLVG